MTAEFPPALIMILGALLVPLLRGRLRSAYLLALPIASFGYLLSLPDGVSAPLGLFGYELTLVRIDALSLLFGYLFHLAALIGLIYALRVRGAAEQCAALVYAGAAIGAVFAGDLITLFVFWEILAVSSVFLIWSRRSERSYRAGMRYLIVQIASGVIMLAGVAWNAQRTGSIAFDAANLGLTGVGGLLIFIALGIKGVFPLLHNWATDAYPEASVSGAVFLSAFTTKVAVYALARGFPGAELGGVKVLIVIGVAMTAFPIFYAVIENDLRRVLVYSMINQIGFMMVGIGIGTELSINGAVSHAFNDVLFKSLLFMSMGAVLYRTGKINGSDLGGLYKSMPKTTALCMVGAASISAFPLFSGFVSKSMVMSAALEEGYAWVWFVLLFASAGVFHHAGIKIPFFAFFSHDSGIRCKEAPRNMLVAMSIAAGFCLFNGMFPNALLYRLLPYEVHYDPYTSTHVISQLQLLFFSALCFTWLKRSGLYPPELRSVNLDSDWLYRRLLPGCAAVVARIGTGARNKTVLVVQRALHGTLSGVYRHYGPEGVLARSWATSGSVIWVCILLLVCLIVYYR
jgi:multicomponent Na+:H+ antiporter subunit D